MEPFVILQTVVVVPQNEENEREPYYRRNFTLFHRSTPSLSFNEALTNAGEGEGRQNAENLKERHVTFSSSLASHRGVAEKGLPRVRRSWARSVDIAMGKNLGNQNKNTANALVPISPLFFGKRSASRMYTLRRQPGSSEVSGGTGGMH